MKIDYAVCIFCKGSGQVTEECACPTCNGVGYFELSPEAKEAIRVAKNEPIKKKGRGGKHE